MKLAVVHDLAEALAGDIAPFQNVSKEEKRRLEEEGLKTICDTIGNDAIGERPVASTSPEHIASIVINGAPHAQNMLYD